MNGIPAETASSEQTAPAEEPKAAKKPRAAAHRAHVAPSKAKSAKKATGSRQGSKTAKVLDLVKRSGGVTLKELTKATGWQAHSVRGFLSGALGKKMGLTVKSTKAEGGERRYSVKD